MLQGKEVFINVPHCRNRVYLWFALVCSCLCNDAPSSARVRLGPRVLVEQRRDVGLSPSRETSIRISAVRMTLHFKALIYLYWQWKETSAEAKLSTPCGSSVSNSPCTKSPSNWKSHRFHHNLFKHLPIHGAAQWLQAVLQRASAREMLWHSTDIQFLKRHRIPTKRNYQPGQHSMLQPLRWTRSILY